MAIFELFFSLAFFFLSEVYLVLFWPGLASKPQLWLSQTPGQAKAINQGLALAWPGPGHGFYKQNVTTFPYSELL